MVLRFKVWRLGWEHRPRSKRKKWVLVLRDKKGRIRKVAHNALEEYQFTKWFEKYNLKERLETLIEGKRLKEHIRRIKRKIRGRGFTYQMSLYGNFVDPDSGRKSYRRYEIFKASKWTQDEVANLHEFFKTHVPKSRGGVFVYHNRKLLVDEEDELTKLVKQAD